MNRLSGRGDEGGGALWGSATAKLWFPCRRARKEPQSARSFEKQPEFGRRECAFRDFAKRKVARAGRRCVRTRLRVPVKRVTARGGGQRQGEPVRQDLCAIEDDERVHDRTSCCFPCG